MIDEGVSCSQLCLLKEYQNLEECCLDIYQTSRSQIKKFLNKSCVRKQRIRAKDEIKLPRGLTNYLQINPDYCGPIPTIIFEDDEILALDKPIRIHSHPHHYDESNNILSYIRSVNDSRSWQKILDVNSNHYDRGLLFRLDFETSGVLVYIKKQEGWYWLRDSFSERVKNKNYLAIVSGQCRTSGGLENYLLASEKNGMKQKVVNGLSTDYRLARLFLSPLEYNNEKDLTLLLVKLETGVRHQIRAQLSALGYPILGDELYGGRGAERLFLHSYIYEFATEKRSYKIQSQVPELFKSFFKFDGVF